MEKKIRLTARKGGISGINGLHHCVRNAQKPPTTLSVHPDLTHTEQSTANLSFTHTHITARLFSGFCTAANWVFCWSFHTHLTPFSSLLQFGTLGPQFCPNLTPGRPRTCETVTTATSCLLSTFVACTIDAHRVAHMTPWSIPCMRNHVKWTLSCPS